MKEKRRILVVDDIALNREVLTELLGDDYAILEAASGREALNIIRENFQTLSLILLDIMMPELDGFEVLKALDKSNIHIPVIVITASSEEETEKKALSLGAAAVIRRPLDPDKVKHGVDAHLKFRNYQEHIQSAVEKGIEKSAEIWTSMMQALAEIIEYRNIESGQHVKRTSVLTRMIILAMNKNPKFGYFYSPQQVRLVYEAASLHDIGKISVPDNILLKPAKLTPDEYEQMKRHTVIGFELSEKINKFSTEQYRQYCGEVTLSHHEKWDGTGYPNRLSGTAIPLAARIVAIADTYDAITGNRPYRMEQSHEKAVLEIRAMSGTQFDPYLVSVFCSIADEIKLTAKELSA